MKARFKPSEFAAWSFIVWTLLETSVAAQESKPASGAPAPSSISIAPRVEVSGERDVRRSSVSLKSVVSSADIASYGDSSVVDVLRRVPGISISGVPGRSGELRMQGLGSGYTQILVNGDPVAPGFSLDSIAPSNIERIEVVRAPTADMSTQAIAGTINIVLKQNVRPLQKDLKASVGGYPGNPSYSLDATLGDRSDSLSYSVGLGVGRDNSELPSVLQQSAEDAAGARTLSRTTNKF